MRNDTAWDTIEPNAWSQWADAMVQTLQGTGTTAPNPGTVTLC